MSRNKVSCHSTVLTYYVKHIFSLPTVGPRPTGEQFVATYAFRVINQAIFILYQINVRQEMETYFTDFFLWRSLVCFLLFFVFFSFIWSFFCSKSLLSTSVQAMLAFIGLQQFVSLRLLWVYGQSFVPSRVICPTLARYLNSNSISKPQANTSLVFISWREIDCSWVVRWLQVAFFFHNLVVTLHQFCC